MHSELQSQGHRCHRENPTGTRLGEISKMRTDHCHSLDILKSMAAAKLVEHAERVMVVHIRQIIEVGLLRSILPISDSVLKEHDGKYHMNHDCLSNGRAKIRIIVHTSQLEQSQLGFSLNFHERTVVINVPL